MRRSVSSQCIGTSAMIVEKHTFLCCPPCIPSNCCYTPYWTALIAAVPHPCISFTSQKENSTLGYPRPHGAAPRLTVLRICPGLCNRDLAALESQERPRRPVLRCSPRYDPRRMSSMSLSFGGRLARPIRCPRLVTVPARWSSSSLSQRPGSDR